VSWLPVTERLEVELCNVGDVSTTLVWWDPWLEGGTLKDWFSRPFELAENKLVSILEINFLGWEEDGEGWKCIDVYLLRRRSRFRNMVLCCLTLCWWLTSQTCGFGKFTRLSVTQSSQLIITWSFDTGPPQVTSDIIWHKAVP